MDLTHIQMKPSVGLMPDCIPTTEGEPKARTMHRPKICQYLVADAGTRLGKPITGCLVGLPRRQRHPMWYSDVRSSNGSFACFLSAFRCVSVVKIAALSMASPDLAVI